MSRATRPTARGSTTRERILGAAVACLVDGGIDEVRVARVARRAGVSTGLVHYHFATRQELLTQALMRSFAVAGELRASIDDDGRSARERLWHMVDKSLPHPGRHRREWELLLELWLRAVREPELRGVAADVYGQLHATMRDLVREGVAAGEFANADPDRAADRVLAAIDGFGLRALLDPGRMPVPRAVEEAWAVLAEELRDPHPRTSR